MRDELDIDSMDFLRFMLTLHKILKVDVPEADYGKLTTINKCIDYFTIKTNET